MQRSTNFGGHSMVMPLQRVLVRRPDAILATADPELWHYTNPVNHSNAAQEHYHFVQLLRDHGVEVLYHEETSDQHADAMFVHDPVLMTNQGAIILRMGKALRRGEEQLMKSTLQALNIPIVGELTDPALAEGGDLLWLDEKTLLAGVGFRTNQDGITQLRHLLAPLGVQVLTFDLPYFLGQDACLHLQSLISLVDTHTALVYLPLLPTALFQLLQARRFHIIEVPEAEFLNMGPNTLAIKPKLVLAVSGNPLTKQRLENAGITVLTYEGEDLSLKTEGGPTCLTRPIMRA